jgi:hypothetical protein
MLGSGTLSQFPLGYADSETIPDATAGSRVLGEPVIV